MLALLVGTGIFLTVRLKFLPWRNLIWYSIKLIFKKKSKNEGDISPFQSLMTALSATVGTGNIVGVISRTPAARRGCRPALEHLYIPTAPWPPPLPCGCAA